MSAPTTDLPADPAVISVLPPLAMTTTVTIAQANGTDGGCTSDGGGTSGGEHSSSKNSPGKKNKRRQKRHPRAPSDANTAADQLPQQQPHRARTRTSSGGSAVSSPEAPTQQSDQPMQPPQQAQSGTRPPRRNSRRSRSNSLKIVQYQHQATPMPMPPALQTLFGQKPAAEQHQQPQLARSPRARTNSTPPQSRRRGSITSNGHQELHQQNSLSHAISAESVNFRRGANRSTMPYRGRRAFNGPPQQQHTFGFNSDPFFNKPGYSNEHVSREIMDYHLRNRQTNERFKAKQILRQALENILVQSYPGYAINLHLVGSTTNGVGDNTSSVDICMLSRPKGSSPARSPRRASNSSSLNAERSSEATAGAESEESNAKEVVATAEPSTDGSIKEEPKPSSDPDVAASADEANKSESEKQSQGGRKSKKDKKKKGTPEKEEAKQEATTPVVKVSLPEGKVASEDAEIVLAAADSNVDNDTATLVAASHSSEALTLESIEKLLHSKAFAKDIKMIPARVSIIKFKDVICNLDVTLNLNQDVSIRNSILIRDFAKMDWRFAPLAMVLKQWAKENHVNSAVDKSISNYSWTLMVVHYLQVVEPPVLPCLQKLNPRRYDSRQSIESALQAWRKPPTKWRSNNRANLRTLLRSMLHYYGYAFHYDQHVISIREGRTLKKEGVLAAAARNGATGTQWNSFLAIEEPFSRTNTTRSVHDKEVFDKIIELLRMACTAMKGARSSLFSIIADDIDHPITY